MTCVTPHSVLYCLETSVESTSVDDPLNDVSVVSDYSGRQVMETSLLTFWGFVGATEVERCPAG